MSESTYKQKGASVHGNGKRYNLTNVASAIELCNTLNNLTDTAKTQESTSKQYDKINKQLVQINMTLRILTEELHTLNQMVKQ